METNVQRAHAPRLRIFQYSLDWRFLLPISDPAKIHVAFENETDFRETLDRIGIPASNQISLSSLKQAERNDTCSFVLPFGLPARWVSARQKEQVELYRIIRNMICPGGYFLLGFDNSWTPRSKTQYHPSTPRRVSYQLNQAGFESVKIFGAMPNLRIPEYVFDLNVQAMHFALQHRFRRKPVLLNMLQMAARTIGLVRISNFFPCYFAVTTA